MRILHVISAPAAGGAETFVRDLVESQTALGHQIHIGFVSGAVDLGRCAQFEREFLANLQRLGVKYFYIGHSCRRMPLLGALRVARYVTRNDVQIYHSHLKYGVFFGALLTIPRVYTHHNSVLGLSPTLFRVLNWFVDEYVGISQICSGILERATRREVNTIRNGISTARVTKRCRSYSIDQHRRFICVGRLHPQKNYPLLFSALSELDDSVRRRISIKIVGEGSDAYTDYLSRLIDEYALGNTVEFVGNRTDVIKLLDESDALLMSSSWEGLPISLLEATASGMPFIATDVGGCREVIDVCSNGILVKPEDSSMYAAAINDMVLNPQEMEQMSRRALEKCSVFDIEVSSRAHIDLYRKLFDK